MKKKQYVVSQFSTAAFVLIPAAIGINYLGTICKRIETAILGRLYRDGAGKYAGRSIIGAIVGSSIMSFTGSRQIRFLSFMQSPRQSSV